MFYDLANNCFCLGLVLVVVIVVVVGVVPVVVEMVAVMAAEVVDEEIVADLFHDQRVIQDQTVNHHVVNHLGLEVQLKNQQAEVLKEVAVKVVAVVTVMTS